MNLLKKDTHTYCLLSREYPPETGSGGIGAYVWHMARLLKAEGIQVTVFSMSYSRDQTYQEDGINIIRKHIKNGNLINWYFQVTKFLLRNKFDLVEDSDFYGSSLTYQLFFKRKADFFHIRLHTCHKIINYYENKFSPVQKFKTSIINLIECSNAKKANLITSPSDALKKITGILWNIPESKIHVVPNPFYLDIKNLKLTSVKDNYLLYFGRLQERKSAGLMLQLIKEDFLKNSNLKFFLIGSDYYNFKQKLSKIKNKTAQKVVLIDHLSDKNLLYSYIANAKLIFLPSKFENFPYAVLESLYFNPRTYVLDNSGFLEIMNTLGLQENIVQESSVGNEFEKILKINTDMKKPETRSLIEDNYGYQILSRSFQRLYL